MGVLAPFKFPKPGLSMRGRWVAVAGLLVFVVVVLAVVRLTADERLRGWMAACEAKAGTVQTVPPNGSNPLLVEPDDSTYRCQSADGRVLGTWR